MNDKLNKLLNNKSYKLATIRNDNTLIYVNNLKEWEKETGYGEYPESNEHDYKYISIIITEADFDICEEYYCTGKNYGLNSILSDCKNENNKIFSGSSINDLRAFLEAVRYECCLYVPYKYCDNNNLLKRKDLKLCFVENNVAYFTNNPNQWGDDWNDKPYECNAGFPYKDEGFELVSISFNSNYNYIEPKEYFYSNKFSAEEINCKFIPWLIPEDVKYAPIFAGESIKDFTKKIKNANGEILYRVII